MASGCTSSQKFWIDPSAQVEVMAKVQVGKLCVSRAGFVCPLEGQPCLRKFVEQSHYVGRPSDDPEECIRWDQLSTLKRLIICEKVARNPQPKLKVTTAKNRRLIHVHLQLVYREKSTIPSPNLHKPLNKTVNEAVNKAPNKKSQ